MDLAAPLLGAVIGYLTNAVAIRMLFRAAPAVARLRCACPPLRRGLSRGGRDELAESIGRMVSRELLTPDVFFTPLRQFRLRKDVTNAWWSGWWTGWRWYGVGEVRARLEVDALIDAVAGRLERAWCDAPGESEVQEVPGMAFPRWWILWPRPCRRRRLRSTRCYTKRSPTVAFLATVDDEKAGETVERLWPAVTGPTGSDSPFAAGAGGDVRFGRVVSSIIRWTN